LILRFVELDVNLENQEIHFSGVSYIAEEMTTVKYNLEKLENYDILTQCKKDRQAQFPSRFPGLYYINP